MTAKNDIDQVRLNPVDGKRFSFENIIGESNLIRKAKELARRASATDTAVIITGEVGTGKESLAYTIHQSSRRHKHNFVHVDCAAISNELIEAELSGYEYGKPGKFELAHNGTIFLNEIGEMSIALQEKLLCMLREKKVERWLGSKKPTALNYRVISATSHDMKKLIEQKEFRLDLFYQLNGINIHLPALRDIRNDIQTLFFHFLNEPGTGARYGITDVSDEALDAMCHYQWPGNIRELRNAVERILILCRSRRIERNDLPFAGTPLPQVELNDQDDIVPLKQLMADTERRAILQALQRTGNNRAEAAKRLGIHRTGLYQKLKKYNIF